MGDEPGTETIAPTSHTVVVNFRQAKRMLPAIYAGLERSFYCGCRYEGREPDRASCGYIPLRDDTRARRIEWEHVVPAAWLGRGRECWEGQPAACRRANGTQRSGRSCCRRIDAEFRAMEGDLHNLVPAIGELNLRRSDFAFGYVDGEEREYGECDFEISDAAPRIVEPRPEIRGDIARIHLYMAETYGVPLEPEYLAMLNEWNAEDPVSPVEKILNDRIHAKTGAVNRFVDAP